MAIEIPARLGYAGGNLKGLHRVLEEIVDAIDSSSDVMGTNATVTEMDKLHDVEPGVTSASKALVVGASKELDTLQITAGGLKFGATAITASAAELNNNAGVTAGAATASKTLVLGSDKDIDTIAIPVSGLKIGPGAGVAVTASAAEINVLKSASAGTAVANKAAVLGANKNLDTLVLPVSGLKIGAVGGTAVTSSAAELNKLTGVTAVAADINKLTGTSAGVSVASKAAVLGASKNLDELGLPVGGLKIGPAGAEVAVTVTAAELNALGSGGLSAEEMAVLNDVAAGTVSASKAVVVSSTKAIDTLLFTPEVVAATGTDNTDGAAITGDTAIVTGANVTKAVLLPTAVAGRRVVITNVAASTLKVYPAASDKINGGTATTGLVVMPASSVATFVAKDNVDWYVNLTPGGVTSTAAELNKLDGVTSTMAELNLVDDAPSLCSFATATGAPNVADTTITVKDAAGVTMTRPTMLHVWLSSDAAGLSLASANDAFAVKAAGGTEVGILTAAKALMVLTKADGTAVLSTTDAGKAAFYINAMPVAATGIISTGTIAAGTDYGS